MRTLEVVVRLDESLHELLIAELADLDFEVFEEEGPVLKAYLPASRWDQVKREQIEGWLQRFGVTPVIEENEHEPENWNARWEETIRPISVGRFLIKPTWCEIPAGEENKILLEIDPKMSFGTGYHESTRLALRLMPEAVRAGDYALDAGTGTGVLIVAALRLGASGGIAFDTDEWAQDNAVENFVLNGVDSRVSFREGSMDVVPEEGFDVILANINRNILLEMMTDFATKLVPGGRLLLAGLLNTDRDIMVRRAVAHNFHLQREESEGEWWSAIFEKGHAV
jgi:ribosomal protein L11 methyltransferase